MLNPGGHTKSWEGDLDQNNVYTLSNLMFRLATDEAEAGGVGEGSFSFLGYCPQLSTSHRCLWSFVVRVKRKQQVFPMLHIDTCYFNFINIACDVRCNRSFGLP